MPIDVEAYYRRYGPMVIRRCRQLLKNEELALEAAQDVFVQLIRKQDELNEDSPSGLLLRMATNICLNLIRSRKRRPEDPDEERLHRIAHAGDTERGVFARLRLRRILEPELESTRTIAVLHYVDGFTLEEVAQQVGLSVSGVRKRLRNLREHARRLEARSS